MLLSELLLRPELKLTVLADHGRLDQPVTRIYVTDLPDPRRYLTGGEVVLTGLVWHRGPADSARFVAALAAAGVAAVGAGDAVYGSVPADLVAACERHRLTLFEVPAEVSFQAIVEAGQSARWARRADGLATLLGRHRGLVDAVTGGARLAELLPRLAAALGVSCWVLTPTGRVVAGSGELAPAVATALARAFLAATRLPGAATVAGRRFALLRVPARPEHRLAAWFLAYADADSGADPDTGSGELPEGAEELRMLAALERNRLDEASGVERRLADQLREDLATPAGTGELRARMDACGLDPDAGHLVVAAALATRTPAPEVATAIVEDIVRPLAPGAAVTTADSDDGEVLAVVPVPPGRAADVVAGIRAATAILTAGSGAGRLAVGVSRPVAGVAALPGAVTAARYARRAAASTAAGAGRPGAGMVCADQLASHPLLLAGVPAELRRSFRDQLLGPVTSYDDRHHAALVDSLRAFLECDGSWHRAAARLHVHVNTLRYRIGRVEQLTGRDLGRFADRVDFYLALELARD